MTEHPTPEVTTELVPDLTTELAEAATAQHRAEHEAAASPWVAVYDTRLERYVAGRMTRAQAEDHGYTKTGRYRLHDLDTGEAGGLTRAAGP